MNGRGGVRPNRAHWIDLGRGLWCAFKTLSTDIGVTAGIGTVLRIVNELHLTQITLRARLDERHPRCETQSIDVSARRQIVECIHDHYELRHITETVLR